MTPTWASVDADVIKAVDAVIDRTIRPLAAAVDSDSEFPAEALADLAGEGLGVMLMPRSLGGAETSSSTYAEALARIAAECGSTSTVYMTQMHCAHPIHLQASPEQVETWIPRLCDGTAVGAIALTEPSAGSDVGTMRTLARRDGDEYVINGEKTFISNGDRADVIVLFASVDLARGKDAVTAFLLETEELEGLRGRRSDEEARTEGRLHRHPRVAGLPRSLRRAAWARRGGLRLAAPIGGPVAHQRGGAGTRVRAGCLRRRGVVGVRP